MQGELMPQGYFDEVQKYMVREGFTLISRVSIDNTECPYHLPVSQARDTRLFFHIRGKSVIVILNYNESDFSLGESAGGVVKGYWNVLFFFRFLPYKTLLDNNPDWISKSRYHDMPILGSGKFQVEGFKHATGLGLEGDQVGMKYEQTDRRSDNLVEGRILAHRVGAAIRTVKEYLDSKPFYRLNLISFFPYYTFCGDPHSSDSEQLESVFWPKFDWGYFRHLVVRPYGYKRHRKVKQEV